MDQFVTGSRCIDCSATGKLKQNRSSTRNRRMNRSVTGKSRRVLICDRELFHGSIFYTKPLYGLFGYRKIEAEPICYTKSMNE